MDSALVFTSLICAIHVGFGIEKQSRPQVSVVELDIIQSLEKRVLCTNSSECAPWMKCENNACVCSKRDFFTGLLKCDDHGISVLSCNCMTYNEQTDQYIVGACIENCMNVDEKLYDSVYHPTFSSELRENVTGTMCEKYNRGGRLCGKCLSPFSPQAYSPNIKCVDCPEGNKNLWKYFISSFVPLTCFYFLILFFKINTTSSYLHGYVLFAQAASHPALCRIISLAMDSLHTFIVPVDIVFSMYGFWSLNFFQTFGTQSVVCLDMFPLTVRALDYTIAVYPFFLTILSYILIELHERNCRIVVCVWRPFRCVFTIFRRNWDIKTSIIDAYATFYQLSFYKILCITQDLLTPTNAYTVGESEKSAKLVLFFDGSVDYFGPEHLRYAIPATIIGFFCVILPVLLLLVYPSKCFQHLMNRFHFSSSILRTFMGSFQCCYKDGTEPGTRDCRWFAAVDFSTRIIFCVTYSFTVSVLFFPLASAMLFFVTFVLINIQPYSSRVSHFIKIDVSFYCFLGMLFAFFSTANTASIKSHSFIKLFYHLALVIVFIPFIYILCYSIHWIFSRRRCGKAFIDRIRAWRKGYTSLEDDLPDRLVNPNDYQTEQNMEDAVSSHSEHNNGFGHLYTD